MNTTRLPPTLEDFYTALALAIDQAGLRREGVMLSKLALLLAHELNDPERALALIAQAQQDLDV
jgi:hypothetical protein